MPVTNQSVFDTASTVFHSTADAIFADGVPGQWRTFAALEPTNSKTNTLNVLEAMPVVREWLGPKQYPDANATSQTLTMKQYEASFAIKRLDFVGDTTGQLGSRIGRWLRATERFYDKIATDVLTSNPTGYDGVALYSASHPRGPAGATQSNITTSALSFANHDSIMQTAGSLRDARSEPIGVSFNVLMVGPKNAKLGKEITQSTERLQLVDAAGALDVTSSGVAAAAVPNVFGGGSMLLVENPRLVGSYDDHCYYFDTLKGAAAVMGFEMRSVEAHEQTAMDSDSRFERDEFKFSLEADVVFGAGAWQVTHGIIL